MGNENRSRLMGEFRSPEKESRSLKLQLYLFEEAGVHDLLAELQREVQYTSPKSKSIIELEARVLNTLPVRSNVELWKSARDLDLPGVPDLRVTPIQDDLPDTLNVRTPQGPYFRLSFFYDIGSVISFSKQGKRDEVSTDPTSYQVISVEKRCGYTIEIFGGAQRLSIVRKSKEIIIQLIWKLHLFFHTIQKLFLAQDMN